MVGRPSGAIKDYMNTHLCSDPHKSHNHCFKLKSKTKIFTKTSAISAVTRSSVVQRWRGSGQPWVWAQIKEADNLFLGLSIERTCDIQGWIVPNVYMPMRHHVKFIEPSPCMSNHCAQRALLDVNVALTLYESSLCPTGHHMMLM